MRRYIWLSLWILGALVGNIVFFGAVLYGSCALGAWHGGGKWLSEVYGPMELVLPAIPLGIILGAFLFWKCELPLRMWLTHSGFNRELVERHFGIR